MNPNSDATFTATVERLARDAATSNELQAALRQLYPRALVRERSLSGESLALWYVYREGRWVSPTMEGDE